MENININITRGRITTFVEAVVIRSDIIILILIKSTPLKWLNFLELLSYYIAFISLVFRLEHFFSKGAFITKI